MFCLSLHYLHGNPQVWITGLSLCPSFHPEINQKVWKCHEMEKHRLMKLTNKLYISFIYMITKSKFSETKINCLMISAMCIKLQGWLAFVPVSWLAPLSQVRVKVYQMLQTAIPWPDLVIYADTPPQHPTTATNNNKILSACSFVFLKPIYNTKW